MQPEQKEIPPKHTNVVLQWVSYALWELTIITLSVLLSSTLTYYLVDISSGYTFVIYFLAALICLLPLAFFADRWYAKDEAEQKRGFSGVVMVLNAIIVFLATIAGLITAVVSTLSVFVNTQTSAATHITIISSLVVTMLGGLLFLRILNPPKFRTVCRAFRFIVVVIAGLTLIGVIAGPFRMQISTRNDRFIEANLPSIGSALYDYASQHRALPSSLNDLELGGAYNDDTRALIKKELVSYKPSTKITTENSTYQASTKYHYEICVTWQRAKGNQENLPQSDIYQVTERHASGAQCYDLQAEVYGSQPVPSQGATDIVEPMLKQSQPLQ